MNNYVKFRVIALWRQEIMQIEIRHKKRYSNTERVDVQ